MKDYIRDVVVVVGGELYSTPQGIEKKCVFCALRRLCYKGDSWVHTDDRADFYFSMLCQNGMPGTGIFARPMRRAVMRKAMEAGV